MRSNALRGRLVRPLSRSSPRSVRTIINDAGSTSNTPQPTALDSLYGITLTRAGGADTTIVFTPRGFASPRLTGAERCRLTLGSRVDSTCVSVIGQTIGQRCVQ